ncbi:unnamed protein product [Peronospora belbahrii]|uniref:ERAP1-like C-terminal domain-containing protein n=1 Tax=Peronospora belbahrii TaxID=622444 RepID=A0AAU9KU92_9STRA|nr:unnamed protein product [Peronospora belbahrii]
MPNDSLLTQENSAEARAPDLASLVLDLEELKMRLASLGASASHQGVAFNLNAANSIAADIIAAANLMRMQGQVSISEISKQATRHLFMVYKPGEQDLVDYIGSVKYSKWESAVVDICKDEKDLARFSIVEVLTTAYGEQTLYDALKVKQAMNEHDEVARSLSDAQVHMWATTGKDPKNVFMWLKGSGNGDFFKPILRRGWETFVKYRNRGENPYELVIEVLKKLHHRDGEDEVDQMLADILTNAVKDKVDVEIYGPFQNALLKTWRKADMTHDR